MKRILRPSELKVGKIYNTTNNINSTTLKYAGYMYGRFCFTAVELKMPYSVNDNGYVSFETYDFFYFDEYNPSFKFGR